MKKVFIMIIAMILSHCHKEKNAALTGTWKLIRYHKLTTSTSETEPATISRSIIMQFSDNGHLGKMAGHTVTNTVSGAYELLDNHKMKTLSFGGTKVGEPA